MRPKLTITLLVVIVTGLLGCTERKEQPPPRTATPSKSASIVERDLMVLPAQAAPGQTVHVSYREPAFTKRDTIDVTFGDKRGHVVKIINQSTIEVLVPRLRAGTVTVTVRTDRGVLGTATLKVIHPPLLRIFVSTSGGRLAVDRIQPYTGSLGESAAGGLRLSYDVVTDSGDLLYTAAIRHPATAEMESFDEDGNIRRIPSLGFAPIVIKIPYVESSFRLQLFEADPGLNLMDPKDRDERRLLQEFTIPEEGER